MRKPCLTGGERFQGLPASVSNVSNRARGTRLRGSSVGLALIVRPLGCFPSTGHGRSPHINVFGVQ